MKGPYKAILFDLGGVLIDIDYQATERAFIDLGVHDFAARYTQFAQEDLFDLFETGQISPQHFINKLWTIHQKYNSDNKTAFTGDMGAFNYLIRTQYNNNVIHGNPVNTEFKKYLENTDCWFKHK